MGLVLKTAFRYLKAKKTHSAVNIISIISVCGVVIATTALICVLSVYNGFSDLLLDKISKIDPQIEITPKEGKAIDNADSLTTIVSNIAGVETAIPIIKDQALAVYGDRQMPITLKGVPDNYNTFCELDDVILYGNFALQDSLNRYAMLSIGTAGNLQSGAGFFDYMRFYAPKRKGRVNIANPTGAFRVDSLYISAIFQTEQYTYDQDLVFVPIDVTRKLFDYDTQATSIEVKLAKNTDETVVMSHICHTLGEQFNVKNRLMQQASSFKMINMEKWVTFILLTFILAITAFNVISSLSLLIIENDENIRTFKNLGATNLQISKIFITEGILITLSGAILGIILGIILCILQQELGLIKLSAEAGTVIVNSYPIKLIWSDVLIVLALVIVVGLITSLVTALLLRSRLHRYK